MSSKLPLAAIWMNSRFSPILKVEPRTPDHRSRTVRLEPWLFGLRVVDSLDGGLFGITSLFMHQFQVLSLSAVNLGAHGFRLGQKSDAFSHLSDCTPHAIFDQVSSCAIYATKPVIDPVMAIAPLALKEPVKRKLISIIVKNPETCQLTAFVRSLNLLSIN